MNQQRKCAAPEIPKFGLSQLFITSMTMRYLEPYVIFQIVPCVSSETYKDPSGPSASPQGRCKAEPLATRSGPPAKPSAKTSHSPLGLPFLNGRKASRKPF